MAAAGEAYGTMMPMSTSPQPELLKRVLSQGSNGSGSGTGLASTPTNGHRALPLSPPPSGGARTPRAVMSKLAGAGSPHRDGKKDGEKLATDLHQLQVRSPLLIDRKSLPPITESAIDQDIPSSNSTLPEPGFSHVRQTSTNSSSTENSSINHPHAPSSLGNEYGPEGFLKPSMAPPRDEAPVDPYMSAQAMAEVLRADEAIKQINGTDSVHAASSVLPLGSETPFSLPRGYANFANPFYRDKPPTPPNLSASRQSSTSSTTTEASTSSEESDLCIPTIEWVKTKPHMPSSTIGTNQYPTGYQFSPYMPTSIPQVRPRTPVPPPKPAASGSSRRTSSPRRMSATHGNGHANGSDPKPKIPLGATAHSPKGIASAMPSGMHIDEPAEDDDDEDTVGQKRERSPSQATSSESGLDILSQAAQREPLAPVNEPKGKRKAGSAAVAQWRESGIPSGVGKKSVARRPSAKETRPDAPTPPPRKRRRSEVSDSQIDPLLQGDAPGRGSPMDVTNDATFEESDAEEEVNSGDSEYGNSKTKPKASKARGGRKVAAPRGRSSISSASKAPPKKTKNANSSPNPTATASGAVQCEYINPLPPYNRCTDFFTRKYDLPRHMARHARREGELVLEGKLSEDRAALWKTIKDKPKVTCAKCGESFTRMDALKRHQAKQHH